MSDREVCVVTGSRAEYGLLRGVMRAIESRSGLRLRVIATGSHLAAEFGLTYRAIEADGFAIDAKVDMLLSSDTALAVTKSVALGVIGIGEVLDRLKPSVVL